MDTTAPLLSGSQIAARLTGVAKSDAAAVNAVAPIADRSPIARIAAAYNDQTAIAAAVPMPPPPNPSSAMFSLLYLR